MATTPCQSGSIDREQGVSKAGNPRLRTALIQLSWLWLQHEPDSALALVQGARRAQGGRSVGRRYGIALAKSTGDI
ncbi:transposase [Mesorhizobium sp.]|uniref:transposase n=1 Tax=Mesorhizobium sp. TaxID=1871066 RepID=UPI003459C0A4